MKKLKKKPKKQSIDLTKQNLIKIYYRALRKNQKDTSTLRCKNPKMYTSCVPHSH